MEHIKEADTYLEFILSGKRKEASIVCHSFLKEGNSIIDLYESVIKPSLYEVGLKWEQNEISVATEHMTTAITEGILNELYSQVIPEIYNGKKVVLACVDKEEHQVGIKMVADTFEMNGWESFFLGTGLPTSELTKFIAKIKPNMLAISLSVYFNFKKLGEMIEAIIKEFPNLPIIIGGQAFNNSTNKPFTELNNIKYLSNLNELKNYILPLK